MRCPRLPVPARPGTPPQEQRDGPRIGLRRRRRAVPPNPPLPQERIRSRNDSQILIQNRPVPRTRRQPDHERSHPVIPRSRNRHEQLPATSATPKEDSGKTTRRVAFPHVMRQGRGPLEKAARSSRKSPNAFAWRRSSPAICCSARGVATTLVGTHRTLAATSGGIRGKRAEHTPLTSAHLAQALPQVIAIQQR